MTQKVRGQFHKTGYQSNERTREAAMKMKYDPEVDVLHILFSSAKVAESDESRPGVILDYDDRGNIVGIEILDASRHTDNPRSLEYAVGT